MEADRAPEKSSAQPPRRRSEKRQRNKITPVRWAAEEFNEVAAKADKAGLPLGAYLRRMALGHAGPRAQRRPPADHVALRQILGQLGRVGNNINQIARSINYGDPCDLPELKAALKDYMAIRDAIYDALGKNLSERAA